MSRSRAIPFDNTYLRLPEQFYAHQLPTPVSSPTWIKFNHELAAFLGLDVEQLSAPESAEVFAGNRIPEGAEPIATAYAGHQFGGWNPQLGDGRAILLGEVVGVDGKRYDIQLKGAGQTPFSRMGDGRSPVGPVLREYLVSEAMAVLGVPTTRSLAAVNTGEQVFREGVLPGAVLTRVAQSHIRIGTFQYFAARQDMESVTALADYVLARHYPQILQTSENHYLGLLGEVVRKQAELVARWMSLGFIHGVMNTDNMLVCGETVDYGPCAFMDIYSADRVYSSIDHGGRYAYSNQPPIAQWNLVWLAQSLAPLFSDEEEQAVSLAQQTLNTFPELYQTAYDRFMAAKLGFATPVEGTRELVSELLQQMQQHNLDFTLTFRALADSLSETENHPQQISSFYTLPDEMTLWISQWRSLLSGQGELVDSQQLMYDTNPVFIPRNHQIEKVIKAATRSGDLGPFHQLLEVLMAPYDFAAKHQEYALPPRPEEEVLQTFCGT